MKFGVFTRSPRSYAKTVLALAYPKMDWDVIVAYEDVGRTKPFGDGIDKAMFSFGYKNISRVALIGDEDVDVRSAYHAGCVMILDQSSWPYSYTWDNWRAIERMPDVLIRSPESLKAVLENYQPCLPDLERRLVGADEDGGRPRFDRINKFKPKEVGGGKRPTAIYACGRSFAGYKSLEWRRNWHRLTKSIQDHKEADEFPAEWIESVRAFISHHFAPAIRAAKILVTVIPHRPGRKPRLESFLAQLGASYISAPVGRRSSISFEAELLAFKPGVLSQHNDKLGRIERFENVRDHLQVVKPSLLKEWPQIIVIDDVSTTGASLIYAKEYLEKQGAGDVTCLTMAVNITDVLNV